jgi:platelet-activating factor acetylhydrolase
MCGTDLPPYSGYYDVGTIDLEVPLDQPLQFSTTTITKTSKPAFQIDTILCSIFYPSETGATTSKPKHPWVPKPTALYGEGYARLAHMDSCTAKHLFTLGVSMLVGGHKIRAQVDVKLHGPAAPDADEKPPLEIPDNVGLPRFPVVVLSHGTASTRTGYTHFCGELASRGFLVVAVEHRDGSGPGSLVMSGGAAKYVHYITEDILSPQPMTSRLREMQLAMRQAEVQEAVKILRSINEGHGAAILELNSRNEGDTLRDWKNRIDFSRMTIAGHSFGATLALQILKGIPSHDLPFNGGIMFDPGKASGPLNADIEVPILVVHSQTWSSKHTLFHGKPHFETVKNLVQGVKDRVNAAWFLTCKGTAHPSITDAPVINPKTLSWVTGTAINGCSAIEQYAKVSVEFLTFLGTGGVGGVLKEAASHPVYDGCAREIEDREVAKRWQVHVAPDGLV